MKIISLSGFSKSGKDTAGEYLKKQIKDSEIGKFAYALKVVCGYFNDAPALKFENQDYKKEKHPYLNLTNREFLQQVGIKFRDIDEDFWIKTLINQNKDKKVLIITDARFLNELKYIKNQGGVTIQIKNNRVQAVNDHVSETEHLSWDFDYVIENNGTLDEFYTKLKEIVDVIR